jgi:hypothetical protein
MTSEEQEVFEEQINSIGVNYLHFFPKKVDGCVTRHPHPVAAYLRKVGERESLVRALRCSRKILDIGFGFSARLRHLRCSNRITAVDSYNINGIFSGYNYNKCKLLESYFPECTDNIPPHEWCWYQQDAQTHLDTHGGQIGQEVYGALLMTHSAYYFTAEQMVELLLKTRDRVAYITFHRFKEGKHQVKYHKVVEGNYTLENGIVSMQMNGNQVAYVHPDQPWLKTTTTIVTGGPIDAPVRVALNLTANELGNTGVYTGTVTAVYLTGGEKIVKEKSIDPAVRIAGVEFTQDEAAMLHSTVVARGTNSGPRERASVTRMLTSTIKRVKPECVTSVDAISRELWTQQGKRSIAHRAWYNTTGWLTYQFVADRETPYLTASFFWVLFCIMLSSMVYYYLAHYILLYVPYSYCILKAIIPCVLLFYLYDRVCNRTLAILALFMLIGNTYSMDPGFVDPSKTSDYPFCAMVVCYGLKWLYNFFFSKFYRIDFHNWFDTIMVDRTTEFAVADFSIPPHQRFIKPVESIVKVSEYEMHRTAQITHFEPPDPKPGGRGLLVIAPIFADVLPVCFKSSPNNEYVAARTRACVKPKYKPKKGFFNKELPEIEYRTLSNLKAGYGGVVANGEEIIFSFGEWNKRFPGGKQKTNSLWCERNKTEGLTHGQTKYEVFTKREPQLIVNRGKYTPIRPRMVSAVSKPIKVMMGPFTTAASKGLAKIWHRHNIVWYVSGATAEHINSWVNENCAKFKDNVYMYSDYSKFDCTQQKECIENECLWFERLGIANAVPDWDKIRKLKLNTKAFGKWLKYCVEATRGSGECETSVGNSRISGLIALCAFWRYCVAVGASWSDLCDYVRIAVMGDDTIIMFDGSVINAELFLKIFVQTTIDAGFEVKVGCTRKPMEIDFLSMVFYPTAYGIRVGRMAGRNICKMGVILDKGNNFTEEEKIAILRSNLTAALPTSNHVPFLRQYIWALLRYIGPGPTHVKNYHESQYKIDAHLGDCHECDGETWTAFSERFGLEEDDERDFYLYLDESLRKHGLHCVLEHECLSKLNGVVV